MTYRITTADNRVSITYRSLAELRANPQIVLIEEFQPGSGTYKAVDRHEGGSWQNENRRLLLS